jgi:hypothetical protein
VARRSKPATATAPYVVDVQSDLREHLVTRVAVPLADPGVVEGKPANVLIRASPPKAAGP